MPRRAAPTEPPGHGGGTDRHEQGTPPSGHELVAIADELYALPPAEFTRSRNARARELRSAGERELARAVVALAKPSAAAWAVDALVRRRRAQLDELLALGETLREAQESLDAPSLRTLAGQRRQVIAALAREARAAAAEAGGAVGAPAEDEIEQTLQAALADERAALAVRSARLVRPLASTGLDPVDLTDAVAAPDESLAAAIGGSGAEGGTSTAGGTDTEDDIRTEDDTDTASGTSTGNGNGTEERRRREPTGRERAQREQVRRERARREQAQRELAEARRDVQEAERRAREARSESADVAARLGLIERRRDRISAELDELRERLAALESDLDEAHAARRDIEREQRDADAAAERAERDAERARRRLDDLQR